MATQRTKTSASTILSNIANLILFCAQVAAAYAHTLQPFTGLLSFICLCAQAAAQHSLTFKSPGAWKMDSLDREIMFRLAQSSQAAYSSHLHRHRIYSTATFEPKPVWTATAYHDPGERAERMVINFFKSVFKSIIKYTTWAVIALTLFNLITWWLQNADAIIGWIVGTRQAIQERYVQTRRCVERIYDDYINATIFTRINVAYQLLINWTARNKYRVIVGIWVFYMASTMIRSQSDKPVFLTWGQFQKYVDQRIPHYVLFQRHGSTWQHMQLHVIDDVVLESAGPLSTPPTTSVLPMAATEDFEEDAAAESRRKLPGEEMAFCDHCKQKHCCEVYVH